MFRFIRTLQHLEYTQGTVDYDSVKTRYSLQLMI